MHTVLKPLGANCLSSEREGPIPVGSTVTLDISHLQQQGEESEYQDGWKVEFEWDGVRWETTWQQFKDCTDIS